jgi:hypothetical protein
MTIELTRNETTTRELDIAKIIRCGFGRIPDMLDVQLCPETLVVREDGSWDHIPDGQDVGLGMAEKIEYGRCQAHGRIAVYNAIPPRNP